MNFFSILLLVLIAVFVWYVRSGYKEKEAEEKRINDLKAELKNISYISVIGTREAHQTREKYTENFTIYSLLIVYNDGRQEMREVSANEINLYSQKIKIKS